MESKIICLKNQINQNDLLIHQDGDCYYILSENNPDTFILLQCCISQIIVWSYDVPNLSFTDFLVILHNVFKNWDILFPFMNNIDEIEVLCANRYQKTTFVTECVDTETGRCPSYLKRGSWGLSL
jgi:hypothetical protein